MTGKNLHMYEFQEDSVTRLFTMPYRTAENGNSDICVVNRIGNKTAEQIVLHRDGQVRATYRGQEDSTFVFDPSDVWCDSNRTMIVQDRCNKTLHLLNSDGIFLRYLPTDMFDYPQTIALYQGSLWVGFENGAEKNYKYTA